MKNGISFRKILLAMVALLLPAMTQAHSAAEGLLHETFHDQYHLLGVLGLVLFLAVGALVAYFSGRALWTLALVSVAVTTVVVGFS